MVKRRPLVAALVLGLGLMAAPAIFQMFSRAPKGGRMIDDFRPYMTHENVAKFQRYMTEIDGADKELQAKLPGLLQAKAGLAPADAARQFPSLTSFEKQWPEIKADMGDDMLVKIERMIPNFAAVDALPPFPLFPWFFVLPGAFVAIMAGLALRRQKEGLDARPLALGVAGLGIAIVLAPAVFQMFSRAPKGKEMIDVFKPLMTEQRVATTQSYFLVIGAAEGEVRTQVQPFLASKGVTAQQWAAEFPAVARFAADWPKISTDFAPMIGAMADNLDNYAAVKALPPFSLFPWFFVVPGLLIAGLAMAAARGREEAAGSIEHADAAPAARLERRGT